ncbi:hypothetical protein LR48_Vigan05g072000 [Vigna angularis]|uniref:Uncharacterized protein n=1 Tax=Phaseolus angularis TaxID=3914 RepID=A0A0L9UKA3_PHAAN|nr:hypothetical protein LR48_Vigan05g072000 [Vigna angularis]
MFNHHSILTKNHFSSVANPSLPLYVCLHAAKQVSVCVVCFSTVQQNNKSAPQKFLFFNHNVAAETQPEVLAWWQLNAFILAPCPLTNFSRELQPKEKLLSRVQTPSSPLLCVSSFLKGKPASYEPSLPFSHGPLSMSSARLFSEDNIPFSRCSRFLSLHIFC